MTAGKPLTVAKLKPGKLSASQPKPCPTCYAPMRIRVGGEYECVRHGKPDRP